MNCNLSLLSNFIEEYEELLIGKRTDFSQYFFESTVCTQDLVVECIRYACEELLNWTPRQVCSLFHAQTVELMKLQVLIQHINFPFELEKDRNLSYVLHLLYPDLVPFTVKSSVINIYKQILDGKIQFPRNYATGEEGVAKLCICMQYAIEHYHPFSSVKEMYEFFSSMEGVRFMKKYGLFTLMNLLGMDSLSLLHEALPPDQRDNFYFIYYSFQKNYKKQCRMTGKV